MAEELKTREGPPLTGRRLKGYILRGIHLPVRSRWGQVGRACEANRGRMGVSACRVPICWQARGSYRCEAGGVSGMVAHLVTGGSARSTRGCSRCLGQWDSQRHARLTAENSQPTAQWREGVLRTRRGERMRRWLHEGGGSDALGQRFPE